MSAKKPKKPLTCSGTAYANCDKLAVWIRHTQFAGDHPLCDEHAREDKKFGTSDSYQDWSEIEDAE